MRPLSGGASALAALVIVGIAALLAVTLPRGGDRLTRKARWLTILHRVDCDVDHAFGAEATIAAVCRDGRVVPFYGQMPCSETALCAWGVPFACWEAGAPIPMAPGLSDDRRRSLLP